MPLRTSIDRYIDYFNSLTKNEVLRYLVWVIKINFWGLCPQTPGVYRLNTNPEEVKRGQQ
jgi:hypothetical protein